MLISYIAFSASGGFGSLVSVGVLWYRPTKSAATVLVQGLLFWYRATISGALVRVYCPAALVPAALVQGNYLDS